MAQQGSGDGARAESRRDSFEQWLESSRQLYWEVDQGGCLVHVNPAWQAVLGYAPEEMIGQPLAAFVAGEALEAELAASLRDPQTSSLKGRESALRSRRGAILHVVLEGERLRRGENAGGMAGIAQDITAHKTFESTLLRTEEQLRAFITGAPTAIAMFDNDLRYLAYSERWLEDYGLQGQDLIGRHHYDVFPSIRENEFWKEVHQRCLRGEIIRKDEDTFVGADGKQAWLRWDVRPWRRSSGDIGGIMMLTESITARKVVEKALAAEKERLAVTLRSIGDGVIATDTRGRVTMLNVPAEVLTGWSQAEAEGRPLAEVFHIVHEISRLPCESPVDKVLATGGVVELANHTVLVARDGTRRIIADSGSPIRNAEGQTVGVVLVFRDMTEKQRLIEAAQRTQKLESLGVLAGGIAHDFNNLLGGIFGYIDLAQALAQDSELQQYLAQALGTIDRARGLTQQLLTFAKGGAPIRQVAPLFPFVEETVRFALSGSAVTGRFEVAEGLHVVDYDRNQVGQVVDNLVINALQSMPLGGTITVSAENVDVRGGDPTHLPPGAYVRLTVSDTGAGIPAEVLPRIFDPFFTTRAKGSGLGLAIAHSIVHQHDGVIEVRSEPGKGATFQVSLPAATRLEVQAPPPTAPHPAGAGLVVAMDDEEAIRKTVARFLELHGYSVATFAEGRSMMAFLQALPAEAPRPVAILLDLTVPGGMGGLDALALVRAWDPTVPVFVSSGYAEDPVMAEPARFGVTASIPKPFRGSDLVAMLGKHTKRA